MRSSTWASAAVAQEASGAEGGVTCDGRAGRARGVWRVTVMAACPVGEEGMAEGKVGLAEGQWIS